MSELGIKPYETIDIHCHVGVLGRDNPAWGRFSEEYQQKEVFKIFLRYVGLEPEQATDPVLYRRTKEILETTTLDRIVCLALDPMHEEDGTPRPDLSHVWVSNEYILHLRDVIGPKVLLGASVHPYATDFEKRTRDLVQDGAVLMKWLPSAQQIDLSSAQVANALRVLKTAKNGGPLPLLLHVGPEYAIPSWDDSTKTYDFLSWSPIEALWNSVTGRGWKTPNVKGVRANLSQALEDGNVIIFAHCGLPYFNPKWMPRLEHSDFSVVRDFVKKYPGKAYADVSAFATPFRKTFFGTVKRLPPESLVYGSDFPTPTFRISDASSNARQDFKDLLKGKLERILIPHGNQIDIHYQQLVEYFPGHALFLNFHRLLD